MQALFFCNSPALGCHSVAVCHALRLHANRFLAYYKHVVSSGYSQGQADCPTVQLTTRRDSLPRLFEIASNVLVGEGTEQSLAQLRK